MTSIANDASLGRQRLRRSVNERIRSGLPPSDAGTVVVFCECGRSRCSDRVQIPVGEFDELVRRGRHARAEAHR